MKNIEQLKKYVDEQINEMGFFEDTDAVENNSTALAKKENGEIDTNLETELQDYLNKNYNCVSHLDKYANMTRFYTKRKFKTIEDFIKYFELEEFIQLKN